jgi:hypothetical protein
MNNADSSVLTPNCVNVRPEDTILLANFIPLCTAAQQTHVHIFFQQKKMLMVENTKNISNYG